VRDLSEMMRGMLLQNGIKLDPPAQARTAAPAPNTSAIEPVDRDEIYQILFDRGASQRELEWLVPSCPSAEHARAWSPPQRKKPETP
jgi:hypothetical protein